MRCVVILLLVLALALPLPTAGVFGESRKSPLLPGPPSSWEEILWPKGSRAGENAPQTLSLWHIERVEAPKIFWQMGPHSLALDSSGHPHVAYGGDFLYYAWYNGAVWQIQTVDSSGAVGEYTSLALDAEGRPHVSYYDNADHDLKYAYYDGTTWHIETVDSAGYVGEYTSLALDAEGRPHISYCLQDPAHWWACDDLKYTHFDGTSWQIETVDNGEGVGGYTSLALDAEGRPHISYYDETNGDLKYAWKEWLYRIYLPLVVRRT